MTGQALQRSFAETIRVAAAKAGGMAELASQVGCDIATLYKWIGNLPRNFVVLRAIIESANCDANVSLAITSNREDADLAEEVFDLREQVRRQTQQLDLVLKMLSKEHSVEGRRSTSRILAKVAGPSAAPPSESMSREVARLMEKLKHESQEES